MTPVVGYKASPERMVAAFLSGNSGKNRHAESSFSFC